ncbi:MAG: hypothetical protein Q4G34_10195 [Micrococcus sp.]|nr:hypothetical protein [Micrococcus sp.]
MPDPSSHVVLGATTAHQVVFVGPTGVGKTTAVTALSDIDVVGTDVTQSTLAFTEVAEGGKTTTTVGIDYGEWTDPEGRKVGLYGTPGQVRFSSARTSVTAARSRLVLWIYGQRPDASFQVSRWLDLLGDESVWQRTVIVLTRLEAADPDKAIAVARHNLDPRFHSIPMTTADPRVREDVARVTLASLALTPGSNG